ncbi:uncharacterized protein CELE_F22E5.23 [Caenorhabditis elegans]|uniref:Conserved domain protein n=1 Tax=Caenorhabditis elegans TaxID=6239 RepID=A0A5S9MMF3_CAEEL|nr:uncharacterized protein CELE_F22E5.23 [Caenorhabditis elegans]CAA0059153.1 Conserved domain protein [Caenorhabditis elegans]
MAVQQKPLLIIGYVHDTDRLHSMSLPKNFNVRAFIDTHSNQFEIYFKEHKNHKFWTATIMTEHNGHQQNFELPPPIFDWGQTSSFLLGLEKMIEQYNSR